MDAPTDAELMQRTRAGDHGAFECLVDRYKDQLVNYLTHLCGSRDSAEEYAQEAFLRLYQQAGRYDERGKLAPLLFRIATNLYRTDRRRAVRWTHILLHFPGELIRQESHRDPVVTREIGSQVGAALSDLPTNYRSALVLREIEEWSYEEIAEALGCRVGTVKSRINRAREQMRRKLSQYWMGELRHEPRPAA